MANGYDCEYKLKWIHHNLCSENNDDDNRALSRAVVAGGGGDVDVMTVMVCVV